MATRKDVARRLAALFVVVLAVHAPAARAGDLFSSKPGGPWETRFMTAPPAEEEMDRRGDDGNISGPEWFVIGGSRSVTARPTRPAPADRPRSGRPARR